jgi:multidrug efflux pump
MRTKLNEFIDIVKADPAVADVVAFTGGSGATAASCCDAQAPGERKDSADKVVARLRMKLPRWPARACSWCRCRTSASARQSDSQYQYTLQSDDVASAPVGAQDPPALSNLQLKTSAPTSRTTACRPR